MNREMVETWRYLRDHGKPVSERDAADYAKIRDFTPPDKPLLKLHNRVKLGMSPRADRNPPVPQELAKYATLEFHKRVIGQLGGSLTVAPIGPPERKFVEYIPASRNVAATEPKALYDDKEAQAFRRREREMLIAKSRRMYADDEPDMFRVLDAFGSFEQFKREI